MVKYDIWLKKKTQDILSSKYNISWIFFWHDCATFGQNYFYGIWSKSLPLITFIHVICSKDDAWGLQWLTQLLNSCCYIRSVIVIGADEIILLCFGERKNDKIKTFCEDHAVMWYSMKTFRRNIINTLWPPYSLTPITFPPFVPPAADRMVQTGSHASFCVFIKLLCVHEKHDCSTF